MTPQVQIKNTEGKQMVRKIDKTTGEIVSSLPPGLWSPFPIPAYKILGRANEHNAQKVLTCLVSHLGDKGMMVHPSYDQIQELPGISRTAIRPALDVLEGYEFIKIKKFPEGGGQPVNHYYIQEACYDVSQMNKRARYYLEKPARCLGCAKTISYGDYRTGPNGPVHLRCGGSVLPNKRKVNKTANKTK